MTENDIIVREAKGNEAPEIHDVLTEAFTQYQEDYTKEAYIITVVSTEETKRRLDDTDKIVLVALRQDKIIGTATVDISANTYYLQSMAVRPGVQQKGIGMMMLKKIEEYARGKGVAKMTLECYEPLTKAIGLYKKFGFKRTGKSRSYHGIVIFEMEKELLINNDK